MNIKQIDTAVQRIKRSKMHALRIFLLKKNNHLYRVTRFNRKLIMNNQSAAIAEAYYTAMGRKDIAGLEKYLHEDVVILSPLAEVKGKPAVLETVKNFMSAFDSLTLRATFGSADAAMAAYTVVFPGPIGVSRAAALVSCKDNLITHFELFYDARPFVEKKNEIFSASSQQ